MGGEAFAAVKVHMKQGQSLFAEKGAMMSMSRTITMTTQKRSSGILKSLKVAALGGESFWLNTFTAQHGPGELSLVGPGLGDMIALHLHGGGMILQKGAYLANAPGVNIDTNWQGLRGAFAEGSLFMLHATGQGTVWISSFGAMVEKELKPGETLSVDNGHLVAWPDNVQYQIRKVGGWKSTLLSGEGLVVDFTGPAKLILQTRHWPSFAQALIPYLPQQR